MKKYSSLFWYVALSMLVFIADRATKSYALINNFSGYKINDFLEFDLVLNRGISWGMFGSGSQIIFVCISSFIFFVTMGMAFYGYIRFKNGHNIFAEVMIVSASLSNIFDRIFYSGVIDFIQVSCSCIKSLGKISFPIFNLADVFIFFGVIAIMISIWRAR